MSNIEFKNKYLKYKSKYFNLKNKKKINRKALLILFGESFRLGGQYTRNKGSNESYNEQIAAAKTHLKFINLLKEKNINLDVYITSYSTKFDNDIKEIYSPYLINSIFYKDLIIHKNPIYIHLKNSISKISNIYSYDFILCMRIDIFLKDYL